jgi:hypothetical protein
MADTLFHFTCWALMVRGEISEDRPCLFMERRKRPVVPNDVIDGDFGDIPSPKHGRSSHGRCTTDTYHAQPGHRSQRFTPEHASGAKASRLSPSGKSGLLRPSGPSGPRVSSGPSPAVRGAQAGKCVLQGSGGTSLQCQPLCLNERGHVAMHSSSGLMRSPPLSTQIKTSVECKAPVLHLATSCQNAHMKAPMRNITTKDCRLKEHAQPRAHPTSSTQSDLHRIAGLLPINVHISTAVQRGRSQDARKKQTAQPPGLAKKKAPHQRRAVQRGP